MSKIKELIDMIAEDNDDMARTIFHSFILEKMRDENVADTKDKEMELELELALPDDDDGDYGVNVPVNVSYKLFKEDELTGDMVTGHFYTLSEDDIEFEVIENFEFNGAKYYKNSNIDELFGNVFFDDSYVDSSDFLRDKVEDYFLKPSLTPTQQEDAVKHLLFLIIEKTDKEL